MTSAAINSAPLVKTLLSCVSKSKISTPVTRPLVESLAIFVTALRYLNIAPSLLAAVARFWAASSGSFIYPPAGV